MPTIKCVLLLEGDEKKHILISLQKIVPTCAKTKGTKKTQFEKVNILNQVVWTDGVLFCIDPHW